MFISKFFSGIPILISGILITTIAAGTVYPKTASMISKNKHTSTAVVSSKSTSKDGGEKTAEEAYKNIKVLKGMPASRLIPTMRFIEASLGMDCGSCHVRNQQKGWEFDKDDKPEKRKARKMIEMMEAINNNSFKGEQEVTCYTCHHGNPDPQKIPSVQTVSSLKEKKAEEEYESNIISVPNRLNTPEEIINKYISAIGGKEAFNKITSLKYEGTTENNGRTASVTIYQKAPDLYYSSVKFDKGEMTKAYNGKTGWASGWRGTWELKGDDLEDIKLGADFYLPIDIQKDYSALKLNDVQVINGDTVYTLDGKATQYRTAKLYFSTKTGLLVRQVIYNQTPLGKIPVQTDFTDYKNVNGILFPFENQVSTYENVENVKFNKITANVPVAEKMFDMPAK